MRVQGFMRERIERRRDRNYLKACMAAGALTARATILSNHGLMLDGRSIPEAFMLIYYLENCCQSQARIDCSKHECRARPSAPQFLITPKTVRLMPYFQVY